MKITGVEATWAPNRGAARGRFQGNCLVEIKTDDGLTGCAVGSADLRAQLSILADAFLAGEDARGVTGLWERMVHGSRQHEGGALFGAAISLLDVALWDLKAKANDEPLWKALGGMRPRINAHASATQANSSDEDLRTWFTSMAGKSGVRSASITVGSDAASDLRRIEIMSQALSIRTAEAGLMINAQGAWNPKQAVRRVREIEERFDLTWVEAPTRSTDFLGLKRVSSSIRGAVCAGAALGGPSDFLAHFHHRSLDVVQLGVANGGITGALQLADTAFGFELPVALAASPGHVNAHLGAVMPNCMSLAIADVLPHEGTFTSDVRIEDGWAVAGDCPGHGLVIERNLS